MKRLLIVDDEANIREVINTVSFASGQLLTGVTIVNNISSGGVNNVLSAEQGKVIGTQLESLREGNLSEVTHIETQIDFTSLDYIDNLNTESTKDYFSVGSGWRILYFQVPNDAMVSYKLGSANSQTQYAIVVSDSLPSLNGSYTGISLRIADYEGTFQVQEGQYICITTFPNVPSYLPSYVKYSADTTETINIFDIIGEKSESSNLESTNLWGAIEEVNDKIKEDENTIVKTPFFIECASFFFSRKPVYNISLSISGTGGSKLVSVISGDTSTLVSNASIVIKDDNGSCKPYVVTSFNGNSVNIFPALDDNITNGVMSSLFVDAQHLTKDGFTAWSEHLYKAIPRYCEKNKYIDRYCPLGNDLTSPFTKIGGATICTAPRNDNTEYMMQYGNKGLMLIPYSDLTGEQGAEWEVDTSNYNGYLETFIGTCFMNEEGFNTGFEKDSGHSMFIEVWADGVKIFNYEKKTNIIERFCIPYSTDNKSVKLKVYYNGMRRKIDTIFVGSTTFWINESNLSQETLFPKYSTLSWFMASWGEYLAEGTVEDYGISFGQGASGLAMRQLISDDSGLVVPIYIRSKSGTTTRWGKVWWHILVREHHPNIMVTSFGVNDYHTNTNPGVWEDFEDPYGNIISMATPITTLEYADNIEAMFQMCLMNDIIPIQAEGSISQSMDWILSLIDNHSIRV